MDEEYDRRGHDGQFANNVQHAYHGPASGLDAESVDQFLQTALKHSQGLNKGHLVGRIIVVLDRNLQSQSRRQRCR